MRVIAPIAPTTWAFTVMSEKNEKTYGSSSSLTFCGGHSMHVPCIQRTNALVPSTSDLVTLASTLLISGSGGDTCTSGAVSVPATLKSGYTRVSPCV